MFNLGRFNLMRFNVYQKPGDEILDAADMTATAYAAILHGGNWFDLADMPAALLAAPSGGAALLEKADLYGYFGSLSQAVLNLGVTDVLVAAVGAQAHGCLTLMPADTLQAGFVARASAGANSLHAAAMAAAVFGQAQPARNFYARTAAMDAFVSAQASTTRFEYLDAYINVDIPPSSTLVMDSNGYVVLLDGEDVIWAQTGDWLILTRDTYDVTFDLVDGQSADKQILYTERWL